MGPVLLTTSSSRGIEHTGDIRVHLNSIIFLTTKLMPLIDDFFNPILESFSNYGEDHISHIVPW